MRSLLPICVVTLLGSGMLSGAGRPGLNQLPPRPIETLIAPPLAEDVRQAFTDALLLISRVGHPTFARARGTGFQAIPNEKRDLTLLLANVPPGASTRTLPELCEIRFAEQMRNTVVCDDDGDCGRVPANASPTLLCNLQEFARLRTLMVAIHDPKTMTAALENDWSFMNLASRIRQQPTDVLNSLSQQVAPDHLAAHMTYLAVFVLGHELEHLVQASKQNDRLPVPPPREPEAADRQATSDPLGAERVCRNYLAFELNGFKSFGENLGRIAVSTEDKPIIDASQRDLEKRTGRRRCGDPARRGGDPDARRCEAPDDRRCTLRFCVAVAGVDGAVLLVRQARAVCRRQLRRFPWPVLLPVAVHVHEPDPFRRAGFNLQRHASPTVPAPHARAEQPRRRDEIRRTDRRESTDPRESAPVSISA